MIHFFTAGGFLMWPIWGCSCIAITIILNRLFNLRESRVLPPKLLLNLPSLISSGKEISSDTIKNMSEASELGLIFAAGISCSNQTKEGIQDAMEIAGKTAVERLEKGLTMLNTLSMILPLLGLLGTVVGMIKVFSAITAVGVGDPKVLSAGISEALLTTASGLAAGIFSLFFYRHFCKKVSAFSLKLEKQASKFLYMLLDRK